MDSVFLKRWAFFVPISLHLFFILLLTVYTSRFLDPSLLPVYLIFSGVFLTSTLFSLNMILKFRTGVFYYLLNLMFLLGFWFKFSIQKITSLSYREPIGTFALNSESEVRVLWVVICGMFGYLLSQICSYYFFKKTKNTIEIESKPPFQVKSLAILLFFSLLLATINLKFNILLFSLKPSLILPLKGNAIYFLALTRGIIFLFLFYCFKNYSNKMIYWGAVIASICSIGVLSRMVVLTYFAVFFVYILQNMDIWRFKKTITNILLIVPIFFIFSYLTVLISSGLRDIYTGESTQSMGEMFQTQTATVKNQEDLSPNTKSIPSTYSSGIEKKAQTYIQLALGRWIGIEGVMAVDSYPKKSFSFLWNALKEKSYKGRSFYTQVSNPERQAISETAEVYSTSVPGPIAFFYYSGNLIFVFFSIFASTLLCSGLEQIVFKFFNKARAVGIFISTFMVFDFFQFGISPMAFMRYWSFSFFSIAVFYYFVNYKTKRDYSIAN